MSLDEAVKAASTLIRDHPDFQLSAVLQALLDGLEECPFDCDNCRN